MASTFGKRISSALVVPAKASACPPSTNKAKEVEETALSVTATVALPPLKKVTSLRIPWELTDLDLPHVLGTCSSINQWQKLLDNDEAAYGRFMDYDADHKHILITHLPSYGHEKTSQAFSFLMHTSTTGYASGQEIDSAGRVTTLAHCEADHMFIPKSLPAPSPGGLGHIYAMDRAGRSYGTFVLETRCSLRITTHMHRKINRWFGPQTSVQLVLLISVWDFVTGGVITPDNPTRWRLEATLYSRTSWHAPGGPLPLNDTPIEFGDVDINQQPLFNPCSARGTHILHIPADLLYANVPLVGVPPTLQVTPTNANPTLDIDLFDLQYKIK